MNETVNETLNTAGHEFNAQPLHSIELEHYARVECSVTTSGPGTTEQNIHGDETREGGETMNVKSKDTGR
jgi:hypothetical protein